jgi:hypothetical protein
VLLFEIRSRSKKNEKKFRWDDISGMILVRYIVDGKKGAPEKNPVSQPERSNYL